MPYLDYCGMYTSIQKNVQVVQGNSAMNLVATRNIRRGEILNASDMNVSNLEILMKTGSFSYAKSPMNSVILDIHLKEEDPMFKLKLELVKM